MGSLTVAQFAQRYRCSREHVYKLIDRGELSYHLIGETRGVRIEEEEANRWYESKKRTNKKPDEPQEGDQPRLGPSTDTPSVKQTGIGSRISAKAARAKGKAAANARA